MGHGNPPQLWAVYANRTIVIGTSNDGGPDRTVGWTVSSTSGRRGTDRPSTAYVLSLGLLVACTIGLTAVIVAGGAAINIQDSTVDGSGAALADDPSGTDGVGVPSDESDDNGDRDDGTDGDDETDGTEGSSDEDDDRGDDGDESEGRGPPDHAENDRNGEGAADESDEDERDEDESDDEDADDDRDEDESEEDDDDEDEEEDEPDDEDSEDFLAELWEELESDDEE